MMKKLNLLAVLFMMIATTVQVTAQEMTDQEVINIPTDVDNPFTMTYGTLDGTNAANAGKTVGFGADGHIDYMFNGDYATYQLNNTIDALYYEIDFGVGTKNDDVSVTFSLTNESDEIVWSGTQDIENNGNWGDYKPYTLRTTAVSKGSYILKILFNSVGGNSTTGNLNNICFRGTEASGDVTMYNLEVSVSTAEAGSVSVEPNATQFNAGESVTVTATENPGYGFVKWTNAGNETVSTENPYTFTISANTELIAVYEVVSQDVVLGSEGTGTVLPKNVIETYKCTTKGDNQIIESSTGDAYIIFKVKPAVAGKYSFTSTIATTNIGMGVTLGYIDDESGEYTVSEKKDIAQCIGWNKTDGSDYTWVFNLEEANKVYTFKMLCHSTERYCVNAYEMEIAPARELVVTDLEDLNATGSYISASYVRQFNTEFTYGTICLPFAPDAATCANYTFYKLAEANAETLVFEEETEPKANVAYLYKLNDGVDAESAKTFTGGMTTISDVAVEGVGGWQFVGSFVKTKYEDLSDGWYYAYTPTAGKNILTKATNSLTVHPYRAFFKFVETKELNFTPAAATMRMIIGGKGDGAMEIQEVIAPEQIEGAVFDLEGRPVEQMQKGQIYIVGGKKVMK